ncbi:MAG: SH3 domain-containing protein [Candidatus Riflebacteria bacterium]|nr:SH3 domain-containing protein [Candidatus Riflebacteria bacterium]
MKILKLIFVISVISFPCLLSAKSPFVEGDTKVTRETQYPLVIDHSGTSNSQPVGATEKVQAVGKVSVDTLLNIRTGPWGDIIGSFVNGTNVYITGKLGDWYRINLDGRSAYVHSNYVKLPNDSPKTLPAQGWVNSPLGLLVRRVPHGSVVGILRDQRAVEILGIAGDYYKIKWGDNEAFVARRYIDTDTPAPPSQTDVQQTNFIGYVDSDKGLNVRVSPWGVVDSTIPNGIAVQVVGKVDDWYKINYNGNIRYVHSNYISQTKPGQAVPGNTNPGGIQTGTSQHRVAVEAKKLVGSTRFRGREVDYGNLACAQVVSTALKNAGAIPSVHLGVLSVLDDLRKQGWKEVSAPPFAEGDVITWKTYDRTGDGRDDPDTHIGIMVKEGNTFKAMNNSSRLRTPRLSDPMAVGPVSRVMRKV